MLQQLLVMCRELWDWKGVQKHENFTEFMMGGSTNPSSFYSIFYVQLHPSSVGWRISCIDQLLSIVPVS